MLTSFIMLFGTICYAETIPVGINTVLQATLPHKAKAIESALESTGLDIEYHYLPPRRSLNKLLDRELAIDAYRTPSVMAKYPGTIQINPAVDMQYVWLVASSKALCSVTSDKMKNYSIAGVRGVYIFQEIFKNFGSHLETGNFTAVASMLHNKRVDFSLWPRKGIEAIRTRDQLDIYICGDKPYKSYAFHSYIHKDYIWALPKIEKAYQQQFGKHQSP